MVLKVIGALVVAALISTGIPVSSTIAPFLAKQAGETGILTLLAGECAYNIPVSQIREWTIKQISGVRND